MRILIVNNWYTPNIFGGGEQSTQTLAEGLAAAGLDVSVATISLTGQDHIETVNGVSVHYLELGNIGASVFKKDRNIVDRVLWQISPWLNANIKRKFVDLLEKIRPQLVHSNILTGFSPVVWQEAKKRSIPVVHTLRSYPLLCARITMIKGEENCRRQCLPCRAATLPWARASQSVAAVVGNSRFILDRHLVEGYFERSRYKDVIFSAFAPREEPSRPKERRDSPVLRIGYLGRVHPSKGIEHLVEAVSELPPGKVELKLAGAGEVTYTQRLESRYRSAGLPVSFLGWVDAGAFLGEIDVLVVPSIWHEPLPRTIFEAYTYGVPVIASTRGGNPEIIEEGKTGWLYDPARPRQLKERLETILADPSMVEGMRPACRRASTWFLPERCAREYMGLYERVLA
jgi:glycosyltransferase involved in cell wall biosynthesis